MIIIIFRQEGIKLHKFIYTRANKMDRRNNVKNNHPKKNMLNNGMLFFIYLLLNCQFYTLHSATCNYSG